ncbi:5-oxoprolinase subunit PxpB [Pontibacter sp. SGAir0037]|uniref:5-oxoprolinase subunit PxpB n=1 Tax=Pontibacter sp. SGAir0037 TaxID=2571030 RepID=UPI0010CD5D7A|nr:5-oxoprolinase subunit PxpB [Pontibacter sp. SGAir0037]QCR23822.1 kinase inhibitor [Pontibacter sp. SGAir0037]
MTITPESLQAVKLYPLGDAAIVVEFGGEINRSIHQRVRDFSSYLAQYPFEGMIELVPAFNNVTIYYNPAALGSLTGASAYDQLADMIQQILPDIADVYLTAPESRTIEIPVCYGGIFGPDLEFVANHNKISVEEVVALHTQPEYLVYMIGFAPGFPYMGGMSDKIAAPRKESPRAAIPQGSVGIADRQTGIYSIETPGGWQLIGRTPLVLFQPQQAAPSLLQGGDKVRFVPISEEEFRQRKEWLHES